MDEIQTTDRTGIMSRRSFGCSMLAVLAVGAGPARAGTPVLSPQKWVRTLYESEIALRDGGLSHSETEYLSLFTPPVRDLWLAGKN
ncbi:MAG TPA: hypothetical protein VMP03_02045, partial [Methylomirabilota bacterium]|nr:hypothetical protein [Methylomirabilota bacterium]